MIYHWQFWVSVKYSFTKTELRTEIFTQLKQRDNGSHGGIDNKFEKKSKMIKLEAWEY